MVDVEVAFSQPQYSDVIDADLLDQCLAWAAMELAGDAEGRSIGILIADLAEISRLHDQFFGDPSATDVVSFPSGENPKGEGAHIGDIAICLDVATEQADDAGHSLQREVMYLTLHGLLHLLGYDDQSAPERRRMLDLQESLLRRFESEVRKV